MKKILFLAMMIALFILPVVGFADNTAKNEVKLDDFEITTPEKEESLVTTDSMVLTGIGKEFDSINIDVYSVKKNKNKEIKVLTESYELQLKEGLNYITVLVNRDSKKYSFTKKVIFDKKLNFIKTLDYTKNKK